MIPAAAVFVVGDDDYAVFPNIALLHRGDEVGHVLLARDNIGVSGVFVVFADRLNEDTGGRLPEATSVKKFCSSCRCAFGPVVVGLSCGGWRVVRCGRVRNGAYFV